MSRCIAALFFAAALIAGAGVLVVKARDQARARVSRRAAHLVALRERRLFGEVGRLVQSAALYSQSSDGIIAFANAGPTKSAPVMHAAHQALNQLRDVGVETGAQVSIRTSADQSVLKSSPNVGLGVGGLHGRLPRSLTGFRDLASVTSSSVVSLAPTSTGGAMAPLHLFAPIRTAVGRPSLWLSLTIPADDLIGVYEPLAHTQTLLGDDIGQPPSSSIRSGTAVVRSQLDKLVAQSGRQSGAVVLDGHIWAYEMLPTDPGDTSYPWSFIASRTEAPDAS